MGWCVSHDSTIVCCDCQDSSMEYVVVMVILWDGVVVMVPLSDGVVVMIALLDDVTLCYFVIGLRPSN